MMLSFWADAVVAFLLVATIGYSVMLNRRLAAMRSDRDKFESVIRELTTASQRAEHAVVTLRAAADELGRRLDKKIDEGRALSDDLAYMAERGGSIADKLEAHIRAARDGLKPDLKPEPRVAPRTELREEHRVEPVIRRPPPPASPRVQPASPTPPAQAAQAARATTFEALLRRAPKPPEPIAPTREPESANMASRAERELLRALARRR
jgi:Domain of unknown function (DUF6468)